MFNFLRSASSEPKPGLADIIAKAKSGEMLLIDVRDRAELQASGTAQGAAHIPLALIAMKADPKSPDFDKRFKADKPVAVFCASGGRSGQAAAVLQRLGYQAVNIGGFGNWVSAGGPVVRV